MYFSVAVPDWFLGLFCPRKKQIGILELLWVVLAVAIWPDELKHTNTLIFEDNEGARGGLIKAMSPHWDINVLLAFFWGATAQLQLRPWFDRVSSEANPADALTKPGLDKSHLESCEDCSGNVDWQAVFNTLAQALQAQSVPKWQLVTALVSQPSAAHFQ